MVNFWGPGNLAGLDFETYTSEENKAIYWYTIAVGGHRNRIYIYIFTTITIDFFRRFQISQSIGPFGLLNKYSENFLLPESADKIKRDGRPAGRRMFLTSKMTTLNNDYVIL